MYYHTCPILVILIREGFLCQNNKNFKSCRDTESEVTENSACLKRMLCPLYASSSNGRRGKNEAEKNRLRVISHKRIENMKDYELS